MKKLQKLLIVALLYLSIVPVILADCVLKMAYKEGDKIPLIAKMPDNSGAYSDLFDAAAKKIGCRLEVVRLPKKRLHAQLAKGKLDFYPGASFSKKRAKYLYYMENGFLTGEYGLSPIKIPDLHSFGDVKKLGLVWLMEHGGSKIDTAKKLGIKIQKVDFVDINIARKLFTKKRSQFYVVDKELIDYYPKREKITSFEKIGLKIHKNCCGGDFPMYLGFSRFSPHFKENSNPNYDNSKKLSQNNFPVIVSPGTIAHRLGEALQGMKKSGSAKTIYDDYFSK